ncbi:MAG TPA: DUF3365 domain-containing protein [Candidatus Deferrimicrobiaceae bacterium]
MSVQRVVTVVAAMSFVFGGAVGAATTEEEALAKGRRVANVLSDTLRDQLASNIQEKGVAEALPQCYYQALTVGKEIETTTGVKVKRISSRLRNQRNTPDAFEQEALARFERFAKEGSMPTDELRREAIGGKPVFRYVKPIMVGSSCLRCHGDAKAIPQDVRHVLDEKYPEDKAIGYKEGDFRGLVSEVIPVE